MISIVYYIAAVDPMDDFIGRIDYQIRQNLPVQFVFKGFRHVDNYLGSIKDYPSNVPLAVIGDIAARSPNIEEGIFVKTKQIVPRVRCLAYTAEPTREDWIRLMDKGAILDQEDIVDRLGSNPIEKLISRTRAITKAFIGSDEYQIIIKASEYLRTTSQEDESLWDILIEGARGSEKGKCLFYDDATLQSILRMKALDDEESTYEFFSRKLIDPDTWLSKVINREKLNFLIRPIIEDLIRYKLIDLYRRDQDFRDTLGRLKIPIHSEGWRVVRDVCKELLEYSRNNKEGN